MKTIYYPTGDWEWYSTNKKDRMVINGKIKKEAVKVWFDYVCNLLKQEIGKNDKVLDAGCGEGIIIKILKNKNISGFDVWKHRVAIAKKLNPKNRFKVASIEKIPYRDKEFDCSYTVHVFEQCDNIKEKALKEMLRVTKDKLIFVEPIYEHGNIFQRFHMRRKKYLMGFIRLLKEYEQAGLIKIEKMQKLRTYANPLNPPYLIVVKKLK